MAAPREAPRPERLGEAFVELLERLTKAVLSAHGGSGATVVVHLDYERLLDGIGTAHLDIGDRISAGEARRLACSAGVIPSVLRRMLDGPSVVLDPGRTRRLHTEHQRLALATGRPGCSAEGCDRPTSWCHTHHDTAWTRGGPTDLANGRLLCGHHHRQAHSPRYRTETLPDGRLRYHRRQ